MAKDFKDKQIFNEKKSKNVWCQRAWKKLKTVKRLHQKCIKFYKSHIKNLIESDQVWLNVA